MDRKLREALVDGVRHRYNPITFRVEYYCHLDECWDVKPCYNPGAWSVEFLEIVIDLKKDPYEPQKLKEKYIEDLKYRYNPETEEVEYWNDSCSTWFPSSQFRKSYMAQYEIISRMVKEPYE